MKIESIRRYAKGSSPIIGIPVFHVTEGRHLTAIFRRDHLQAALSAPVTKATYDEKEHVLVLNGRSGASYRLRNLQHVAGYQRWQVREQLTKWASGRKKSARTRGLDVDQKRIIKLQAEIAKLERARDKIHPRKPHSPLLLSEWERQPESESARRQESRWREEKPIRRALGALVRRDRKTWADFYREVEQIIGRFVSPSYRHERVCNRKGGPDRFDYLKYIYKHVGLATKPYERSSTWNPFRVYEWAGEDHGLNRFQAHRRAQIEYLGAMRERATFDSMIDGLRAQIADLTNAAS